MGFLTSEGQEGQLELDLRHLSHHILVGQTQVDAGGIDVSMSELLLEGVKAPFTVQEEFCHELGTS